MADSTQTRTLRVTLDGDSSGYVKAMNDKVAADKAATASNDALAESSQVAAAAALSSSQKISSAADGAERLRRTLIAGYSATADFQKGLSNISRALDLGKFSTDEASAAIEGLYRKYGQMADASKLVANGQTALAKAAEQANSKIQAQQKLHPANNNASNYRSLDVAFQAQDTVTQAIGGSLPTTIGFQQGPQLAGAFAGQTSKEALSTLGSGLLSLISPVNLLSIGFVTLGAAGIQALQKIHGSVKPLADSLKDEEDALKRIAAAYGGVAEQAAKAGNESRLLVDAIGARSNVALSASVNVAAGDFFSSKDVGTARSAGRFGQGRTQLISTVPQFQQAITDLQKSFKAGKADFDAFYEAINQQVALDPKLGVAGDKIIVESEKFKQATDALKEYQRIRDALFNDQGPGGRLLSQGTTSQKDMGDYALFESQQRVALARSQQGFDAQVAGVNARSPGERADAARKAAAAQYNNDETPAQRNQRINQAGELAEIQAQKALTDAQRDRELSLQKTLSDQQMEINLIGKTGGEAAKLRQEYQLTEQLRQEAAKNGTEVDQKEIDLIKQKSDELGKLTDQYNKAKLANDLSFERAQIFRSPQDQQIASRLQSAGLPVDLQSNEASLIRQNLQASSLKDGIKGFFSDFQQSLVSNGGKVGEALGKSIKDTLLNALTKIGDAAEDKLANYVISLLTGTSGGSTSASSIASSSGGLLGAIFGGNSGGGASNAVRQAANSNIAVSGDSLSLYRAAIGKIESGNNYGSLGPLTASGDRAYGAYQVMGANIPSWTKGALGESLTPSQFLATPSAQDAVFNKYFGSSVSKFGNPQDAASVWFTGRPLAQGANASDVLGTTGSQYVNKFNDALGKMTDSTKQATQGLGQLGTGLGQVGQSLSSSFFPAAPAKSGGGFGGWLSSLFGGGGVFKPIGAQASLAASGSITGLFANGTDFSPGGVAMVGENGRELVNLPRGSQVIPNHRTEAMMRGAANSNSGGSDPAHIQIGVSVDDDGGLQGYVKKVSKKHADEAVNSGLFNYSEGMRRQGIGTLNARYNSQKG